MPFGLSGAPATFQHMIDQLTNGMEGFAAAYLDNLVIYSNIWEECVSHLDVVFELAGLTVKPRKCQLAMSLCVYLGHVIGSGVV